MSWNITMKVEKGKPEVASVGGEPPDGTYTVAGHDAPGGVSLSASQSTSGRYTGISLNTNETKETKR